MSNTSVPRGAKGLDQLRQSIRQVSGLGDKVLHPRDFMFLEESIAAKLNEPSVTEKTLKRFFGYDKTRDDSSIRLYTLDVLSQYVGYADWNDFLENLPDGESVSSGVFSGFSLDADSITPGTRLQIEWNPGRRSVLKYCGERRFEIVETQNSKWQVGDTFSCKSFILDRPLYVDKLSDSTGALKSEMYYVGEKGGLSSIKFLTEQ